MTVPVLGASHVPDPPSPLDCAIFELPSGSIVHRIHDARFDAAGFNPGFGRSRFAPLLIAGTAVPTFYAATSLECAVFESIFHDIEPTARDKSIRSSALDTLLYSTLETSRPLRLAALFSADLSRLGIERNQLIDTPRSTYDRTQAWSAAFHGAGQSPEGLIWVSRRYDQERAFMLFGDRAASSDLAPRSSVKAATDPACLRVIHDLAQRAGILIAK